MTADPGAATPADVEALIAALHEYADARDKDVGFATGLTNTMREAAAALARVEQERDERIREGWQAHADEACAHERTELALAAERAAHERAEEALRLVDEPYPLDVFPERTDEQRDAIFAAMRAVDRYATEWFYAHVARERGRVAREALREAGTESLEDAQ